MEQNIVECDSEKECACKGGATLDILKEVQRAYERRLQIIERLGGAEKMQMQVQVLRSWVSDLVAQNALLVRAVEELERETTARAEAERRRHAEIECELRAETAVLRRRLARKDSDLRGLIEVLRRLREFDHCTLDGIHFFEHIATNGGTETDNKILELSFVNDALQKDVVAKDREIRRLNKDLQQYEQTMTRMRDEMKSDVPKKNAEVMAGMCCTGTECGDLRPVKDIGELLREETSKYRERLQNMEVSLKSSTVKLRTVHKVNLGLIEELNSLRRVCIAVEMERRDLRLKLDLEGQIVKQMVRQLRQAKAKLQQREMEHSTNEDLEHVCVATSTPDATQVLPEDAEISIIPSQESIITISDEDLEGGSKTFKLCNCNDNDDVYDQTTLKLDTPDLTQNLDQSQNPKTESNPNNQSGNLSINASNSSMNQNRNIKVESSPRNRTENLRIASQSARTRSRSLVSDRSPRDKRENQQSASSPSPFRLRGIRIIVPIARAREPDSTRSARKQSTNLVYNDQSQSRNNTLEESPKKLSENLLFGSDRNAACQSSNIIDGNGSRDQIDSQSTAFNQSRNVITESTLAERSENIRSDSGSRPRYPSRYVIDPGIKLEHVSSQSPRTKKIASVPCRNQNKNPLEQSLSSINPKFEVSVSSRSKDQLKNHEHLTKEASKSERDKENNAEECQCQETKESEEASNKSESDEENNAEECQCKCTCEEAEASEKASNKLESDEENNAEECQCKCTCEEAEASEKASNKLESDEENNAEECQCKCTCEGVKASEKASNKLESDEEYNAEECQCKCTCEEAKASEKASNKLESDEENNAEECQCTCEETKASENASGKSESDEEKNAEECQCTCEETKASEKASGKSESDKENNAEECQCPCEEIKASENLPVSNYRRWLITPEGIMKGLEALKQTFLGRSEDYYLITNETAQAGTSSSKNQIVETKRKRSVTIQEPVRSNKCINCDSSESFEEECDGCASPNRDREEQKFKRSDGSQGSESAFFRENADVKCAQFVKKEPALDSGGSSCAGACEQYYRDKLLATLQILENKEETIRVQGSSLAVAGDRIAELTKRATELRQELEHKARELNHIRQFAESRVDKIDVSVSAETKEAEAQKHLVETLEDNLSTVIELYRECFYETAKQEELIDMLRKSYLDVRLIEKDKTEKITRLQNVINTQKRSIEQCQDVVLEVESLKSEISSFLNSSNNDSGMWERGSESPDVSEELADILEQLRQLQQMLTSDCTCGFKKEFSSLKERSRALEAELEKQRQRNSELERVMKKILDQQYEKQMKEKERELEKVVKKLAEMEDNCRQRDETCETLTRQLQQTQVMLTDKTAELVEAQKKQEAQESTIRCLQQDLTKSEQLVQEGLRKLSEVAASRAELLLESQARITELEQRLRHGARRCRDLETSCREREACLEEAHIRGARLCDESRRVTAGVKQWMREKRQLAREQQERIKMQRLRIRELERCVGVRRNVSDLTSQSETDPCSNSTHEYRLSCDRSCRRPRLNATCRSETAACPCAVGRTDRERENETASCTKCPPNRQESTSEMASCSRAPVPPLRKKKQSCQSINYRRSQASQTLISRDRYESPANPDIRWSRLYSRLRHSSPTDEVLERVEHLHAALSAGQRRWGRPRR